MIEPDALALDPVEVVYDQTLDPRGATPGEYRVVYGDPGGAPRVAVGGGDG